MTIYPTIFTDTSEQLERQLSLAQAHFTHVQIDIADGKLVEGTTLGLDLACKVMEQFPQFTYDMHLMVQDYTHALTLLDHHSNLKFRYVLIHASAHPPAELFLTDIHPFRLGLVVNPDESIETISHTFPLEKIPAIQIMTVVPGAQGRPFEHDSLNFIDQLYDRHYTGDIILDGAINETTTALIQKRPQRPTIIGPGSYFSNAQTPEEYAQKRHALERLTR